MLMADRTKQNEQSLTKQRIKARVAAAMSPPLPLGSLSAHAVLEQAARKIRLRDPEVAPKLAAVNGNVKRTKKKVAAAPKPTPKATNRQSGRTRPRRRTRSKAVVQKKA